jgi:hypothetical protein
MMVKSPIRMDIGAFLDSASRETPRCETFIAHLEAKLREIDAHPLAAQQRRDQVVRLIEEFRTDPSGQGGDA